MAYLVDHPPARSQYRHPRRAKPTGCIVLHSAENAPDVNPPDTGADSVAKFIVGRSDPGSYHIICDSDSAIQLVDFADEAFQDGTGSNPWAIGISGAFRANQWTSLPDDFREGVVDQLARAAVRAATWLHDVHGIVVPAVELTRDESEKGRPGFISHARRDPGRRSDPGDECLRLVITRYAELTTPPQEVDMTSPTPVSYAGKRWTFIHGVDDHLWGSDSATWFDLGGTLAEGSSPGATLHDGGIDVEVTGVDGKVYGRSLRDGKWSPWWGVPGDHKIA